ncbi:alpha/beta fold hydrolase [candidate division KSB1 bacterium]|nr:alpha/beta fold hydrolase [candidate division KSB1 bacterium]
MLYRIALIVALLPTWLWAGETVRFRSSDGVNLVATLSTPVKAPLGSLLLFHMLGKDRTSWDDFAQAAVTAGYTVLAVDLRGHGESRGSDDGELNYKLLPESSFRAMTRDLAAAVEFVRSRSAARVTLIGASIGANVAISYAATDTSIAGVVLLSPGEVFRGVMTKPAMAAYGARPMLLVAAEDDNYSALTVATLQNLNPGSEAVVYPTGGHGTYLLESRPELTSRVLQFVESVSR